MYVPFWILLILHGPNFWKWFILPGCVYGIERIMRIVWMKSERGKTYISSGLLLPSKVTHLVIKRPLQFDFHPGDYVFVNIPAIAKYEWHPFTISSAPEQEGTHSGRQTRFNNPRCRLYVAPHPSCRSVDEQTLRILRERTREAPQRRYSTLEWPKHQEATLQRQHRQQQPKPVEEAPSYHNSNPLEPGCYSKTGRPTRGFLQRLVSRRQQQETSRK